MEWNFPDVPNSAQADFRYRQKKYIATTLTTWSPVADTITPFAAEANRRPLL